MPLTLKNFYKTWWQPWANTLVYYNISDNDTNSTIYDLSWNWIDQNWIWTASYAIDSTYGRVATFDWVSQTSANSIVNFGWEITCIVLVKANSLPWIIIAEGSSSTRWPSMSIQFRNDSLGIDGFFSWRGNYFSVNINSSLQTGIRYMITTTLDSNWIAKAYINWTLAGTATWWNTPNYDAGDNLMIGKRYWESFLKWQFKLFIGENRTWSDTEILSLAREYNLTN